mgnify:FL=1
MSGAAVPLRRLGVFGGSFDPPHRAHNALAHQAVEQLRLDALHIIPTGEAWHKSRVLTAASHRLAMAQLAFADLPKVVVDDRETRRLGPSYTVDTLTELAAEEPGVQLFLIIGEDQARSLPSWHRWQAILQLAIICVAARADSSGARGTFNAELLAQTPFQVLNLPPMDVSATDIRHRLANRQNVAPLVFEAVARYIAHHHLYQTA